MAQPKIATHSGFTASPPPTNARRDDVQRERRKFYDTARWRHHVRPAKLARDPMCQRCAYLGLLVPARHVDHWTPLAQGGHPTADANLVSLCHEHHSEKTLAEQNGTPFFEIVPGSPSTYTLA
jgi:5-methylcytosine-specific restriction endonuclease McrA